MGLHPPGLDDGAGGGAELEEAGVQRAGDGLRGLEEDGDGLPEAARVEVAEDGAGQSLGGAGSGRRRRRLGAAGSVAEELVKYGGGIRTHTTSADDATVRKAASLFRCLHARSSTRQNFRGTTASWPSGGIKAKWDTIHFEVTERLTIVFAFF